MKNSTKDRGTCIAPIGATIYETVKRKLAKGKIVEGGEEDIFVQLFSVEDEEKLLKVSRCNLSTTAGPIAGQIFVSTVKVAFCSENYLRFTSSSGNSMESLYKVIIPLKKIKRVSRSENVKKPTEKYLEMVTVDNFDFWFMSVVNYQRTLKCIQEVIFGKTG